MRRGILPAVLMTVCIGLLSGSTVFSQTKRVVVRFKTGTSGATYTDTVTGYGTVDFVIKAGAGQTMSVKLTSPSHSLYFVVSKSGSDAIDDSARDATQWSGQLPETGEYVVRVYLFRNAARTTHKAVGFTLQLDVI